ncbi:MAG TPA: hypothetical protein VK158_02430 [Acidobacteriota bacterium]|nr:hypothetical protein [Acidobacteriota bacterium]
MLDEIVRALPRLPIVAKESFIDTSDIERFLTNNGFCRLGEPLQAEQKILSAYFPTIESDPVDALAKHYVKVFSALAPTCVSAPSSLQVNSDALSDEILSQYILARAVHAFGKRTFARYPHYYCGWSCMQLLQANVRRGLGHVAMAVYESPSEENSFMHSIEENHAFMMGSYYLEQNDSFLRLWLDPTYEQTRIHNLPIGTYILDNRHGNIKSPVMGSLNPTTFYTLRPEGELDWIDATSVAEYQERDIFNKNKEKIKRNFIL